MSKPHIDRLRPLEKGDTLKKTFGCRQSNPDNCSKHSAPYICAFVRADGFCQSPPSSWKKLYGELLEKEK